MKQKVEAIAEFGAGTKVGGIEIVEVSKVSGERDVGDFMMARVEREGEITDKVTGVNDVIRDCNGVENLDLFFVQKSRAFLKIFS